MSKQPAPTSVVKVLHIRFDEGAHPDYPITTLLIDGQDRIAEGEFVGFDPADIIDSGALLPRATPRRVALYRCAACGMAGCGCAAAIIRQDDDCVVWEDFRNHVGEFDAPTADGELDEGEPLPLPDFVFNAEQYRAAVAAASDDRSWETRPRRLARELRNVLAQDAHRWLPLGWSLGSVSARHTRDRFGIVLHKPNGQVVVEIPVDYNRDDTEIRRAAAAHLASTPTAWNVVATYEQPAAGSK